MIKRIMNNIPTLIEVFNLPEEEPKKDIQQESKENKPLQDFLKAIRKDIEKGENLTKVMDSYPEAIIESKEKIKSIVNELIKLKNLRKWDIPSNQLMFLRSFPSLYLILDLINTKKDFCNQYLKDGNNGWKLILNDLIANSAVILQYLTKK